MTATGTDIVELDRIAVYEALRVVELAQEEDWERDTPCAGWNLRRLVAHLAAQHHGFAVPLRAARARTGCTGGSRRTWASRPGHIARRPRPSSPRSPNPAPRSGSSPCRSWA
ncbi:maleylpyruvate isomerase N-terminal domain-containing protein [Streptomyces sp. L7]